MLTFWDESTSRPRLMSNRAPHLWKMPDSIAGEGDLNLADIEASTIRVVLQGLPQPSWRLNAFDRAVYKS